MRPIRRARERLYRSSSAELRDLYESVCDTEEIRRIQLERFNGLWQRISSESGYYARLRGNHDIPAKFESWAEFAETMPVMTRSELQEHTESISLSGTHPEYWRITGGTTAEPLQLPAWRSEDRLTARNTWYARSWFGATTADRLFLLWGHSHVLGSGVPGKLNAAKRYLKDRCVGYVRHSAYDLGEEKLRSAGDRLLRARPGYILGYATALHRLAQVNQDRADQFRSLGIKVVIASGEPFPSPSSRDLIANTFGCPVVVEYGAIETGTIAHEQPSGGLMVFWDSYYVEGVPSDGDPNVQEILITALYPRLTPLVRYRIGDLVAGCADESGIGARFDRIVGRANEWIEVGEGGLVHSEAFDHVMRDIETVQTFQVVQARNRAITINYTSNENLPPDAARLIDERLKKVDSRLGATAVRRVPRIDMTAAGKSRRVVSHVHRMGDDAP